MAHEADISHGQLPLQGVILCCTSLTQDARTNAQQVSTQMGAIYKLDLTSDVTHILVGNVTTPKYRYVAKERPDVKVLHPDWLEDVRLEWMEGNDVDLSAIDRKHTLPPFFGLHICVTGFENLEQRNFISETVQARGAKYHGDLTKQVTHLIAAVPQGAKYIHAGQWGIPVVSLKWLEDSLTRGMALDESLYNPTLPLESQGKGAFNKAALEPKSVLGKRLRPADTHGREIEDYGKRRLRRTASTRLSSQSQDMWQGLSASGSAVGRADNDAWQDSELQTAAGSEPVQLGETKADETVSYPEPIHHDQRSSDGLFSGWHVFLHGFQAPKAALLQKYLEQNGATIVDRSADLENSSKQPFFVGRCVLVPHAPRSSSPNLPDVSPGTILATEWWVERCLHQKSQINPKTDVLSQPLYFDSILELKNVVISTTGFVNLDLRQAAEAVRLAGATYSESLQPSTSVLVSASSSIKREKALYASKHNIPVVNQHWLWECLQTRRKAAYDKYLINVPAYNPKDFQTNSNRDSPGRSSNKPEKRSGRLEAGKDDTTIQQRLSNSRSSRATPSLPLKDQSSTTKTVPRHERRKPRQIFQEDDEDDVTPQDVQHDSDKTVIALPPQQAPLLELSPNKSPRRRIRPDGKLLDGPRENISGKQSLQRPQSLDSHQGDKNSPPSTGSTAIAQQDHASRKSQEVLTANLQSLLARQRQHQAAAATDMSAFGSTRAANSSSISPSKRRKNQPLGRAASGLSTSSLSLPTSDSNAKAPSFCATTESATAVGALAPQNTQLTYETPDAEPHREQMAALIGAKMEDERGKGLVEKIGLVRDIGARGTRGDGAGEGVGGRIKGRQRIARTRVEK